jgi:methyltransferase (TIGR00027 family)
MMRAENDSWDLTTGVGVTATMVAAARAIASREPDPVINDPYAAMLVRAVGIDLMTQLVDGEIDFSDIGAEWLPRYFGIRCRAFDDFAAKACRHGIRQVVIPASGLDCRAYRLDWPAGVSIYELDQPAVIDWKHTVMTGLGHRSAALHHCVGVDLREDWPNALRKAGFHQDKPTVWLVEGLLIGYLPREAQDELLDTIDELSSAGSRIMAEHVDVRRPDVVKGFLDAFNDSWRERDPNIQLRGLTFSGARNDPAPYLAERGWSTRNANLTELFREAGRPGPRVSDFPANSEFMLFLDGTKR